MTTRTTSKLATRNSLIKLVVTCISVIIMSLSVIAWYITSSSYTVPQIILTCLAVVALLIYTHLLANDAVNMYDQLKADTK